MQYLSRSVIAIKQVLDLLTTYFLQLPQTERTYLVSTPTCDIRNYWADSIKCGVGSFGKIIAKKKSDSNAFINQHSNY
jgi:hypothetical protein